ncbi:hypothetical protein Tco_1102986 [Tanacetum coccineum]
MINFIDVSCEDSFSSSGSTTLLSDSRPSLVSFETSDSLLEEFADELALLDPFPPGNEDVDFKADLREIELLLNHDPSTDFSPKITIDPNPERFTDEPALACLPPPRDDNDDKSFLKEDGDILLLEKFLNDDPSSSLPSKELNFEKLKMIKSSLDDFPPLDVLEEYFVTFSNPLFDSNDDFTSSDDESLPNEDVSKDNVKIYSNPLFEFSDEYISSEVNPLFNEELEDIESNESCFSNLDEPALLVTPLFDANGDECFDPGGVIDEIDAFLDMDISTDIENGDHDSEGDIIYLESLLIDDTIPNLPSEVFLDHDPRSLKDEPDNDDLMSKDKVFNLRI